MYFTKTAALRAVRLRLRFNPSKEDTRRVVIVRLGEEGKVVGSVRPQTLIVAGEEAARERRIKHVKRRVCKLDFPPCPARGVGAIRMAVHDKFDDFTEKRCF